MRDLTHAELDAAVSSLLRVEGVYSVLAYWVEKHNRPHCIGGNNWPEAEPQRVTPAHGWSASSPSSCRSVSRTTGSSVAPGTVRRTGGTCPGSARRQGVGS